MELELLAIYIDVVCDYYHVLQALYQKIEQIAKPKYTVYGDIHFFPTATTITQQIQQWPEHIFRYPPTSWVEPRKGECMYQGAVWSYAFHGGGLSFLFAQPEIDVSGEFSRNGMLGITEYTTQCYISDKATHIPRLQRILLHHEAYFQEIATQNIIKPAPPFFDGDDGVYVITDTHKFSADF